MSIDYERAYAEAADRPAFSNGTESMAWMYNWCDRCLRDAPARSGLGPGCPLVLVAYLGKTPIQWLEQPWGERGPSLYNRYHCIEFRAPGDGGNEPKPRPDPPGQDTFLPREPFEATRMLVQADERLPVGVA